MKFSVIYEVDLPRSRRFGNTRPRGRQWAQTEGDECAEYAHLGPEWQNHKHRKLCAVLTKEEFVEFLGDTDLWFENVETMGSLGAPGFGCGWAPAFAFRGGGYYDDAIQSAYVTPIPEPVRGDGTSVSEARQDAAWERIRKALERNRWWY